MFIFSAFTHLGGLRKTDRMKEYKVEHRVSDTAEEIKIFEEKDGKLRRQLEIPAAGAVHVAMQMLFLLLNSPACKPLINQSPFYNKVKELL